MLPEQVGRRCTFHSPPVRQVSATDLGGEEDVSKYSSLYSSWVKAKPVSHVMVKSVPLFVLSDDTCILSLFGIVGQSRKKEYINLLYNWTMIILKSVKFISQI